MTMKRHGCIIALAIGPALAFCSGSAAALDPPEAGSGPGAPGLKPKVKIETTLGDIVVELDTEKAASTVLNFLDYVAEGFYDGTVFHRVIQRSVIQGGGFTADMTEKKAGLRPPVADESYNGLKNERGTIAMYREPGKFNSARSQFFINIVDNPPLDRLRDGAGYTVFGRVVDGLDTVERIRGTPVGTNPRYAAGKNPVVPVEPVVIRSIRLVTPFDRPAVVALADAAQEMRRDRLNVIVRRLENEAGAKAVTTESGLRYVDYREGRGAYPLVEEAVEVNYRGTLVDGKEFDSSVRQTGDSLTINMDSAIKGLREGLQSMREGGKRALVVPPELAYGSDGIPGRIPPGSTLVYDIELLAVRPHVKKQEIKKTPADEK
jgi:peptidyl-prolyl cis-trans isomerase A (cyclophilin A)